MNNPVKQSSNKQKLQKTNANTSTTTTTAAISKNPEKDDLMKVQKFKLKEIIETPIGDFKTDNVLKLVLQED